MPKTTIRDGWHVLVTIQHEVVFDTQNSTLNNAVFEHAQKSQLLIINPCDFWHISDEWNFVV